MYSWSRPSGWKNVIVGKGGPAVGGGGGRLEGLTGRKSLVRRTSASHVLVCGFVLRIRQMCAPRGTARVASVVAAEACGTALTLAISHRLLLTLDQYLRSSLCAPETLSTTSSVLASMRWIILRNSSQHLFSCDTSTRAPRFDLRTAGASFRGRDMGGIAGIDILALF